eukprot:CAMPEP_0178450438 /NCGR_PEP_ID=MMETSP0689_2-20121128/43126_1 /TAXON_ID=160604 /ORGANISM="Amphidinium massartii, Strain CS-259" /LENGTH=2270 /DNA_ID=CAMNT_0020075907 /DNA_START=356 /DNA_END=7165 /DNA_ORIENTATION=-
MCNAFPSVPLIACVLFTPVIVGSIRKLASPKQSEPGYDDYIDDGGDYDESYLGMTTEDVRKLNAKYVRNVMWTEEDARAWWRAVFVAFIVTGTVTMTAWIAWAITIGQDLSDINDASLSPNEKEELWILWSTPGIFAMCNYVFALFSGFRVLMQRVYLTASGAMLGTSGEDPTESAMAQQNAAVRQLVALVKIIGCMFVLTIGLLYVGVQLLYTDNKIASMVMGLMGALFILFAVCTYLSFRSVVEAMGQWLKDLPMWKTARSVARSDWSRALFLIIMMFPFPPLLLLSFITQRVRKRRGMYRNYPDLVTRARKLGQKDPSQLYLTPRVTYALGQMAKWERIPIIFKCYLLCAIAFSYQVAPLLLNVGLAWVQKVLADWNFGLVVALTFLIGIIAFLLPPVPGMTIYIFGGLMLSSTCPIGGRGSDAGFWWGALINIGLGWVLKLAACAIQQGIIGGFLGRNLWVRQTVGVHKVAIRSVEQVLRKKGLSIGKVAILCGGPDWPTSVLAGMLRLSLLECELGTMPIILFVAPCSLSGSFYLKKATSQVWERAANMMILLSVVVNVSLWAVAAWAIQGQIEKDLNQLSRPLVQNVDLEWLDFKAKMVKSGIALTWDDVPLFPGLLYVLGAATQAAVVTMMQFRYYWFFHSFQVSEDIDTIKSWDDLITFRGVVAVIMYFMCWLGYFVFSQWESGHTWRQELLIQKRLNKAKDTWKAEWSRLVKAWIDVTPDGGMEEAIEQRNAIAKAAYDKATRPPGEGRQLLLEEEEEIEEERRREEQEEATQIFSSPQVGARAPVTLSVSGLGSFLSLLAVGAVSVMLQPAVTSASEDMNVHDIGPLFYILMGAIWLVMADFVRKLLKHWEEGGERFKKTRPVAAKSKKKQRWPSEFLRGVKERRFEDFVGALDTRWRPPPPGSTFRLSPFGAQDWRNNQLCGVLTPQLMTEQVVKSHVLATSVGLFAGMLAWWVRLVPKFTHSLSGWSDIMFDNLASGAQARSAALIFISIALTVFIMTRVRNTFRAVNLAWQMQGHAQDLAQLVAALLAPLRNDEKAPEVAEALWTIYRYLMAAQYLTYEAVSSRFKLAPVDALHSAGLLTDLECKKLKTHTSEEKFKPGKLGLDMDWINGFILGVQQDSQADILGVREGWQISKINDMEYSQAYFVRRLVGHKTYKLTFEHEAPDSRALEVLKWLSFSLQRLVSTRLIPQAFGAALLRPLEDLAKTSLEMCTTWGTAPPKLMTPLIQIMALAAMALTPMAILESFGTDNDAPTHYVFAVLGSSAIALLLRCTVMVGEELGRPFSDGINALNPDWLLMRADRQIFTTLTTGHVPPIKKLAPTDGTPKTVQIEIDLEDIPEEDYEDEGQPEDQKTKDLQQSTTPSVIKSEWDVPSEAADSEGEVPEDAMSAIRSWSGRSSQADTGGSIATTVFGARVNTQLVEACFAGLEYPKPVTFDDLSIRKLETTFAKQLTRLYRPGDGTIAMSSEVASPSSPRSPTSGAVSSPRTSIFSPMGSPRATNGNMSFATPRAIQAIDAAIARVSRAADGGAGPVPQSGAVGPGAAQQAIAGASPRRGSQNGEAIAIDQPGRSSVVLELLATLHQEMRTASDVRLQAVVERHLTPQVQEIEGPHSPQSGTGTPARPKGKKHRRLEVIPEGAASIDGSMYSGETDSVAGHSSIASEGVRGRRRSSIYDLDDAALVPLEDDYGSEGDEFGAMSREQAMAQRRRASDVLSIHGVETMSLPGSGGATPPLMDAEAPAQVPTDGTLPEPSGSTLTRGITDFWHSIMGGGAAASEAAAASGDEPPGQQRTFAQMAGSFLGFGAASTSVVGAPVTTAIRFGDPRVKGRSKVPIVAFYQPAQDDLCEKLCHAGFLGSHWDLGPEGLHLDGKAFRNAEATFQALKFWDSVDEFTDVSADQALQIRKTKAGTEDRTFNGHGSNWSAMMAILREKFKPGSKCAEGLLQTGDAFLLHHNSAVGRDVVWSNNHRGDGTNWLGMQLMLLRDDLRRGNGIDEEAGWTDFIISVCRVDRNTGQCGSPTGRLLWQECVLDATEVTSKVLGEPLLSVQGGPTSAANINMAVCARPGCGKPAPREGEFCSKACRSLAESLSSMAEPICMRPGCGRPTYNGEPNQYCSRACREQDMQRATGGRSGAARKEQRRPTVSPSNNGSQTRPGPGRKGQQGERRGSMTGPSSPGGARRGSMEPGSPGKGIVACARPGCGKWLKGGQPGDYCSRLCRSLDTGRASAVVVGTLMARVQGVFYMSSVRRGVHFGCELI